MCSSFGCSRSGINEQLFREGVGRFPRVVDVGEEAVAVSLSRAEAIAATAGPCRLILASNGRWRKYVTVTWVPAGRCEVAAFIRKGLDPA
jgi:hypothetical protein